MHSYPHIADWHSVLTEVVNLSEEVPALTALQELQLQQLHSMQQQQHISQQHQHQTHQPGMQQTAMPSGYYTPQQQESAAVGQLQSLDGHQAHHGMSGQQSDWQQLQQQQQPDLMWQSQQQQQAPGLSWMDQQPGMAWQLDQQLRSGGSLHGAGLVGIGSLQPSAQYLAPLYNGL